MSKPKPGRPTRLTTEVIDQATTALRAGATLRMAADSLGIPIKTVLGWRLGEEARECCETPCDDEHHGPTGDGPSYQLFAEEIQKARGQAALRATASVSARFQSDPHFAERWIAKHYPQDDELPTIPPDRAATSAPPLIVRITPEPPRPDLASTPPQPGERTEDE